MVDVKKSGKTILILLIMAGLLTLLLALVFKGFDRLHVMSTFSGLIFFVIGVIFIAGRSIARTNDTSWQSMQVRQHMSHKEFYQDDMKNTNEGLNLAVLFIIVGCIYFFLPALIK